MPIFSRSARKSRAPDRGPPPPDPGPWLERTEALVDAYRKQLPAASSADFGLGYIWIAADHIFEAQGASADFALLDVAKLMEDCRWLAAGKRGRFSRAVASFYEFLGATGVIDRLRATELSAALLAPRT